MGLQGHVRASHTGKKARRSLWLLGGLALLPDRISSFCRLKNHPSGSRSKTYNRGSLLLSLWVQWLGNLRCEVPLLYRAQSRGSEVSKKCCAFCALTQSNISSGGECPTPFTRGIAEHRETWWDTANSRGWGRPRSSLSCFFL